MSFLSEVAIVLTVATSAQIIAYIFAHNKGYYYLDKIINLDGKDYGKGILQIGKDGISLRSRNAKLLKFIKYDQIEKFSYTNEKNLTEKEKSVLGRAFVGGLLFGVTGALVGGMSGIGTTKKEETIDMLTIRKTDDSIFLVFSKGENFTNYKDVLKKANTKKSEYIKNL